MRAWVKLYTEALNDPVVGRLTDRQHRTFVNLLLAGMVDDDGRLGTRSDVAWHLRVGEEQVAEDVAALAAAGIVEGRRAGGAGGVEAQPIQLGGQAIDPAPEEGWVLESCHSEEQAKAALGQGDSKQQAQMELEAEVDVLDDGLIRDLLQCHVWGHRDRRHGPAEGHHLVVAIVE